VQQQGEFKIAADSGTMRKQDLKDIGSRLFGLLCQVRSAIVLVAPGLYRLLFLGAVVFVLVFSWHALNQRLPIWDGADFVLSAQKIVERFDGGLLAGLKGWYLERGWRPIAFPALAVPFFILSDGQILVAVGLTQFAAVWLLAAYVYGLLRTMLSPARSVAGALLIVSMQWIVDFSNVFYSEITWLGATAGVLFHTTVAYKHYSLRHFLAGGFWLGLMVALRPAETVLLSIVPAVALILREWKREIVGVWEIGLFVTQIVPVSLAVWLLALPEQNRMAAVGLLGISCLTNAVAARRLINCRSIIVLLLVAETLALAWHLPTIRSLYLWAYDTSFGPMAKLSDQKFSDLLPWEVFWELMQRFSPKILLLMAIAAVFGVLSIRNLTLDENSKQAILIIIIAFLMMAPVLLLLSISGTSDMRRIMPAMLVLATGLVALAFSTGGLVARLRITLLLSLLTAQVVSATANGLNIRVSSLAKLQGLTGHLRQPYTGVDPNVPVLDGILELGVRNGSVSAYTYCYRDYANCERQGLPVFEPVALSTLAKARRLPIQVHFIRDLDFSKPESLAGQIRYRGFNYVLVDMFDSPSAVNRNDPYVIHTEKFIAMEKIGLTAGLINRGCFSTVKRPLCVIEVLQTNLGRGTQSRSCR